VNLTELGELLDSATDVLRVETLDAYASGSDYDWVAAYLRGDPPPDPGPKQWYLDGLRRRAESGHPQRRLRVVPRPVPDYVRYACEWGYLDNVAAGEDVRVLDGAESQYLDQDVYLVDGRAIFMEYDRDRAFVQANEARSRHVAEYMQRGLASLWEQATPFTEWWAANPDLHRSVCA